MKKSLLLLPLLASAVLASCNGGNSSSTSSSTSSGGKPTDWTVSEKKLMTDNLGGFTIPFYYVEGQTVTDEYYEEYGCISVEAPAGTETDLENYETILIGEGFECDYALGDDEDYPYWMQYWTEDKDGNQLFVQAYTKDGTKCPGAWTIDAYFYITLEDYSQYDLTTYSELVTANNTYFQAYEETVPTLPTAITTSATSYDMIDMRYMYYSYFGIDIGVAYSTLCFYNAKENELNTVISAFTQAGYVEQQGEYQGEQYTYYDNGTSSVEIAYFEADEESDEYIAIYVTNDIEE